jgi:type IX secretion system PorP/SprF family membrane protein
VNDVHMKLVKLCMCILCSIVSLSLQAQDASNFTQFFINPYSINPSYAGIEGKKALFLAYRKQWANIQGGPTIANLSFHAPFKGGLNIGFNVSNDARGILNNSGVKFSVAYQLVIDRHKFIRFGVSGGAAWNTIDLDNVNEFNADPALAKALDKNASLIGNAGLSVHLKSFHFGASLPNIFSPSYVSKDAFTVTEVKPFQAVIVHASNRFYFAKDKHVFEPYVVYRLNTGLPSQFEVAGVLHLNHTLWVGGSYKQDFGISALGGLKINELLSVGGSYSLKNSGINELNSPSYEIQLSLLLGAKKKNAEVYSFVTTLKEKEKKVQHKSASEAIAEKRKQDELAKKKQQEELAKKKEEEARLKAQAEKQAQAEALAKKQNETKQEAPVVVTPTPTPTPTPTQFKPVAKHDGGPRLKSESFSLEMPKYDTAHHEEQARISLIDEHAANPTEHHEDPVDFHPNAERHEFVKRGGHHEELDFGDYVIVGVFKSDTNSDHYVDGLNKMGFKADYGHLSEKNLWYVYIAQTKDINDARTERDKYRKMKIFKDAWLLTVHE